MQSTVEIKYILLFAILIALTGFTFESQSNANNAQEHSQQKLTTTTASNK